MSIADAMATNGMKELGYEYINFDGKILVQFGYYQPKYIYREMNVNHPFELCQYNGPLFSYYLQSIHFNMLHYFILDCWADKRDSDGNIVPDKDRFPE